MPVPPVITSASQPKPRQYDEQEWSDMRPIFQQLYIDLDFPLEHVLQELRSRHNIHVTKNMCKRRLFSWGMTKNSKSLHKAIALQNSQREGVIVAARRSDIRPDKLLRFQKQCRRQTPLPDLRQGSSNHEAQAFSVEHVSKPHQQAQELTPWRQLSDQVPMLTSPLTLPDDDLNAYTLLHDVTDMMSSQEATNKELSSSVYVKIGNLIQSGMSLWDVNASAAAGLMFSDAAKAIHSELRHGVALDIRFVYYLCAEVWNDKCSPHFHKLSRFLALVTEEHLGRKHPMSLVVRGFKESKSSVTRLKVWDCLLDSFVKPNEYDTIWWDLAKARWQYCRRIGLHQQAAESCQHARDVMRRLGKLSKRMEADVLMELARFSFAEADYSAAQAYLQSLVCFAQEHESHFWRVLPLALLYLANIHEVSLNLDEAQICLEQRLQVVFDKEGAQGAQTLGCCRDLVRFQMRNPGLKLRHLLDERYTEFAACNQLEAMSEGYWNADIGGVELVEMETCADPERR